MQINSIPLWFVQSGREELITSVLHVCVCNEDTSPFRLPFQQEKKVRYYFHHNFLRPSCNEQNIPGELLEGHGCNGYATTSLHNTSEALCSYVRTSPEGDLRNSPNAGEHSRAGRPESIVIMVVNLIKICSQPRAHMYVCVCVLGR